MVMIAAGGASLAMAVVVLFPFGLAATGREQNLERDIVSCHLDEAIAVETDVDTVRNLRDPRPVDEVDVAVGEEIGAPDLSELELHLLGCSADGLGREERIRPKDNRDLPLRRRHVGIRR